MGWIVVLVIVAVVVFWAVGAYNRLVSLRNKFRNAFAQIDVQLKRRYDLIPNLVETAKAYLKHERETLEAVIQARNQAAGAAGRRERRKQPATGGDRRNDRPHRGCDHRGVCAGGHRDLQRPGPSA